MNLACYIMAWLSEESVYYEEMMKLSQASVKKNLRGLDDIVTINLPEGSTTWPLLFWEWAQEVRVLHEAGNNNVLMLGSDSLLLEPVDFEWDADHMVMPTVINTTPGWPTKIGGRNSHGTLFPARVSGLRWDLHDGIWQDAKNTNFSDSPWDVDQYALSTMYAAQENVNFAADVGYGGFPRFVNLRNQRPWRHYYATRGLQHTLALMRTEAAQC